MAPGHVLSSRQLAATALAATALVLRLNQAQLCALQHAPAALYSSEAKLENNRKTHTSREYDEEDDEDDTDEEDVYVYIDIYLYMYISGWLELKSSSNQGG